MQTCQRITRVVQVWSEKSFLSLVQESFGCKQHGTAMYRLQVYMGKSCLKLDHELHLHKQVVGNIHQSPWLMNPIPAALVCPKTCNTMAEDTCNIASHLSIDRTHDKQGILRQSWSRHVRESPKLFKCEVRSHFFLLSKSFVDAINRARPHTGCKCIWGEACLKPFASTVEHSWITLAHDSYPSSISLSQHICHCGRRCL